MSISRVLGARVSDPSQIGARARHLTGVSIVVCLAGCAIGSVQSPGTPTSLAMDSEGVRSASESMTTVEQPRLAERHYDLARYWLRQERLQAAMQELDHALVADPQHVEALNARAVLRAQYADLSGAQTDLRSALSIDPSRPHLHFNLGLVHRLRQDEAAARDAFRHTLSLDPNHEGAKLVLALDEEARWSSPPESTHDAFVRVTAAQASAAATPEHRLIVQPENDQANTTATRRASTSDRPRAQAGSTTSGAAAVASGEPRIDLANGNGAEGLARALRAQLSETGLPVRRVRNWVNFDQYQTRIYYRRGHEETVLKIFDALPVESSITVLSPASLGRRDVLVVLGQDLKDYAFNFRRNQTLSDSGREPTVLPVHAKSGGASIQSL